jgi:hypothetical protein
MFIVCIYSKQFVAAQGPHYTAFLALKLWFVRHVCPALVSATQWCSGASSTMTYRSGIAIVCPALDLVLLAPDSMP